MGKEKKVLKNGSSNTENCGISSGPLFKSQRQVPIQMNEGVVPPPPPPPGSTSSIVSLEQSKHLDCKNKNENKTFIRSIFF